MKKLLFGSFLTICMFAFAACSNDDDSCTTCTLSVPLIGDTVTELCPSGDGVEQTVTVAGISQTDQVDSTTVAEQVQLQELAGATCN